MSRDNGCAYSGKYDALKTIFWSQLSFPRVHEKLEEYANFVVQIKKKGQFLGDDGNLIMRKDYTDGPMVEYSKRITSEDSNTYPM